MCKKYKISQRTTNASKKHVAESVPQTNHAKQRATRFGKHGAHQKDGAKPSHVQGRHMPLLQKTDASKEFSI